MFTINNPTLQTAILKSHVLQKFLSPTERETFAKASLSLSSSDQNKLLILLQREQQEISERQKTHLETFNQKVNILIRKEIQSNK